MADRERRMDPLQAKRLQVLEPWGRRWAIRMSNLDYNGANTVTTECVEFLGGGYADLLTSKMEDTGLDSSVIQQLRELYDIDTVRDWVVTSMEELEEFQDLRWICNVHNTVLVWMAERLDSATKGDLT